VPSVRVLIADDDRSIRSLLRLCLEHADFIIDEAATGIEALESILGPTPPDLVILDLSMPAMQGMDVLRQLKNMAVRPKPRVIVLTANGSVPIAVEALHLGAADFLEKPCKPERLFDVINHVLDRKILAEAANDTGYQAAIARAHLYLSDDNLPKAEAYLRAANRLAGSDPEYFHLLGLWHELSSRPTDAKASYNLAVTLDPHHGPAQLALLRLSSGPIGTKGSVA
jgi:DNA-binding NtrC family response regulator